MGFTMAEQNHKWPTPRQHGYKSLAFSGVPNVEHRKKIGVGQHVGKMTTKPQLLSTGRTPCSSGAKCGHNGYIIPAVPRVPSAHIGDKIKSGCLTLTAAGAPFNLACGGNGYITHAVHGSQYSSRGINAKWLNPAATAPLLS